MPRRATRSHTASLAAADAAALANPHSAASYVGEHPPTAASAAKFLGQNILLILAQNGYRTEAARCLNLCHDTRENLDLWDWCIDEPCGPDRMTRLMHFAEVGDLARVKWHLERGARMERRDVDGWTALMYASTMGHLAVVVELLLRGADVTARNKDGRTALLLAAWPGHADVVAELVACGADVDPQPSDAGGLTPLMCASSDGHAGIVRELLRRGVDVNRQCSDGWTALMQAAAAGHLSVVTELLAAPGCATDLLNNDGDSALAVALNRRDADEDEGRVSNEAAGDGDEGHAVGAIVEALLAAGAH